MDIQTFVAETLTQIAKGIEQAQNDTADTGTLVSPPTSYSNGNLIFNTVSVPAPQLVSFNIQVTVENSNAKDGGGKLKVAIFEIGAEGKTASQDKTINSISFAVPVCWSIPKTFRG